MNKSILLVCLLLLSGSTVLAQNPTGPLPGGPLTSQARDEGFRNYIILFAPPADPQAAQITYFGPSPAQAAQNPGVVTAINFIFKASSSPDEIRAAAQNPTPKPITPWRTARGGAESGDAADQFDFSSLGGINLGY